MTWIESVCTTPAQIVRRVPAGKDEYGNVIYQDAPPLDTTCRVDSFDRAEQDDGRSATADYTVILPPEISGLLDTFSRLDVSGYRLEVVGTPRDFRLPRRSAIHHVEADVRRSTATGQDVADSVGTNDGVDVTL